MVVTNQDMMTLATQKTYAIGAFNVTDLESVLAVAEASAREAMKEVFEEEMRLFGSLEKCSREKQ
jgi:fructose/tagatose bisphosphate aldolase